MVTYVTHQVVMNMTFLILEDVLNPIIGLNALHQNAVQFHLFQSGKAYLQQKGHKAVLHYYKNHDYASGLVIPGSVKRSILKWDDPEYTIFDPQSTGQVIAEIDFELNSEARLTQSKEQEEEDVSQEAHRPQCLKVPKSVTSAEKKAHFLTHLPFRSWCTVCPRANGQQHYHKGKQKVTSVTQLDHSFYKVLGEAQKSQGAHIRRDCVFNVRCHHCPRSRSKSGCHQSAKEVHCSQWIHKISSSMLWSFRSSSTSRPSWSQDVVANSGQSTIQSSISRHSRMTSLDFCMVKSGQSDLDLLINYVSMQIQFIQLSCHGSCNMRRFRPTGI